MGALGQCQKWKQRRKKELSEVKDASFTRQTKALVVFCRKLPFVPGTRRLFFSFSLPLLQYHSASQTPSVFPFALPHALHSLSFQPLSLPLPSPALRHPS